MHGYRMIIWRSGTACCSYLMTSQGLMDLLSMRNHRETATHSNSQIRLLINQLLLRVRVLAAARHAARIILTNWATQSRQVNSNIKKRIAMQNLRLACHHAPTLLINRQSYCKFQRTNRANRQQAVNIPVRRLCSNWQITKISSLYPP
jgi:hypothetical protein